MNDFARLRQITELALDQKRARMAALQRADHALAEHLAALDQSRAARAQSRRGDDPASRAGIDLHWLQWIDTRKRAINMERARLAAQMEQEKGALATAFGRDQVTQKLARGEH